MITKYYTNGELGDDKGTGVTLACFQFDEDGKPLVAQMRDGQFYSGYLAKEVTKAEYNEWAKRIANPDFVNFFPGIFNNGIVNKAAYDKYQAVRKANVVANLAVTRAAALITLAGKGISKDFVYEKIDELPAEQAAIARVWFDEALTFKRSNEYIKLLGEKLGMTDAQLDELFIAASQVK